MHLTEQQVAEFQRSGALVVRDLMPSQEMAKISAWVDEIHGYPEAPGKYMMYFEDSKLTPGKRMLNRIENFIPYHQDLADLLLGDAMIGRVSELFGEPAVLFKEKVNFKMSGGEGFEPHQDVQAGWEDYASLFITAMVSVDQATEENGCLEIAKWDHRRELVGELWKPMHGDQLAGVEFLPCPTAPGDCVFFDSYLPHRSEPNLSASPRRVIYVTYNRLSEGDHRAQYYADKRKSYPPDCERLPDKEYGYKV
ncbi:MAG: phytanoyl-CoA dioxygenase family protein [Alphaproteobacteria bacterium]